jgi:hypothetical protein
LKPIYLADTVQEEIKIIQAAVENAIAKDEELHLQAAAYANRRKEAYLDYVKKGLAEKIRGLQGRHTSKG